MQKVWHFWRSSRCSVLLNVNILHTMVNQTNIIIIGVSVGVTIGILIAACAFIAVRFYRKRSHVQHRSNESAASLPIRVNGIGASIDSSASISVSEIGHDLRHTGRTNPYWGRRGNQNKDILHSLSGIPKYLYKYENSNSVLSSLMFHYAITCLTWGLQFPWWKLSFLFKVWNLCYFLLS